MRGLYRKPGGSQWLPLSGGGTIHYNDAVLVGWAEGRIA